MSSTKTDMFFVEAQPFEREYSQSQAGGGGGGGEQDDSRISQRQKEIIAATWNQIKDTSGDQSGAGANAIFLSGVQSKLRDQARSLVVYPRVLLVLSRDAATPVEGRSHISPDPGGFR